MDKGSRLTATLLMLLLMMAGWPAALQAQDCSMHVVTLEPFDPVCANSEKFSLGGGAPTGGVYYVDGVFAFDFDPRAYGPGEYTITYEVYFPDGCMVSDSEKLVVNPVTELTFQVPDEYCAGLTEIPLSGGSPSGGHYFGNYVVDGVFNAAFSGPGTFQVFYGYTNAGGCYSEVAAGINILPAPPAEAGADVAVPSGNTASLQAQLADPTRYAYEWSPGHLAVDPHVAGTTTTPLTQSTLYTLRVTDLASGCSNTDDKAVFVSGDALTIADISATPAVICPGEPVQLSVLAQGGSGKYTTRWEATPFVVSNFNTSIRNPVAYPEKDTRFTVTITDNDSGQEVSTWVDVTVEPAPPVTLNLAEPQVCGNDTLYVLSGGWPEGGYYSIPTLNLYNITRINPSQLPAGQHQVTYTLPATGTACQGMATQYLTIRPRVKASFYPQQPWCQTNEVTFLNLSENATTYRWDIGGVEVNGDPAAPYVFDLPADPSDHYDTTLVILRATDDFGCTDLYTREVIITRPTVADFEVTAAALPCSPHTVAFTNNTTGPVGFYLWEFGDGSISGEKDPVHTFENQGNQDSIYTVTLTVMSENFFCTTYDTIEITVHPQVKAGFSFSPPASCSPYQVQFTDNSTGALAWHWDFGDGTTSDESNPLHTFENLTADTLSYLITQTVTNADGCQDTMQKRVVVYPHHEPAFTADVTEGCSPLKVSFKNDSEGSFSSLVYSFGNGSTSTLSSPNHTFKNVSGGILEYVVTLTTDNGFGCPKTYEQTITVYPELKAGFEFSPASVCSGTLAPITNTSSGHITRWQWELDGVQIDDTKDLAPLLTDNQGPDPVIHTLTLEVGNDYCTDRISKELIVNPEVTASFDVTVPDPCKPLEVSLVNNSVNATSFLWELGDGNASGAFEPQHTYLESGAYTVSLLAMSDSLCTGYLEKEITLDPVLEADFNIAIPAGCSPYALVVENLSQGADSWQWKIDGNTVSTLQHPLFADAILNHTGAVMEIPVTLEVFNSNGCMESVTRMITIYPAVEASFNTLIDVALNCHPLPVKFENTSSAHALSYHWDFETGSSNQASPAYTFGNTSLTDHRDYVVTLTATSFYGCQGVATDTVRVNPRPVAAFAIDDPSGCSPHTVNLTNLSEGATDYTWDYGDSTSDQQSQAQFSKTYTLGAGDPMQVYRILLEAENTFGCTDTLSHQVTVSPTPAAAFEADLTEVCHGQTVTFTNLTTGGGTNVSYTWDYGDGTTSVTGSATHQHTFANHGSSETTYPVTLTATTPEGCTTTHTVDITVHPAPVALFAIEEPTRCGSPVISVNNQSGGSTWTWNFDDGSPEEEIADRTFTRTLNHVAGDEPVVYNIALTVSDANGCSSLHRETVTIYPAMEATFTVSENGCHPLEAELVSTAPAGASLLWDLGDGNQSQQKAITHTYHNNSDQPVPYEITLTATSIYGCSDTKQHTLVVWPVPEAGFSLEAPGGCTPFTTQVTNLSAGAESYAWDMGQETLTSAPMQFPYTWTNAGQEPLDMDIRLTATNSYGCQDDAIRTIRVSPRVQADFTTADGVFEGCSPLATTFVNLSEGSQSLHWDFGNGQTATGSQPAQVFEATGPGPEVFAVTLTVTSGDGCTDQIQKDITVYPTPMADFTVSPIVQAYPGTTVTLENKSSPGNWTYQWAFGDGHQLETTSAGPFTHEYDWDGQATQTYNIVLTTFNDHCSSTTSQQVTITTPVPVARFIPGTQGCAPLQVEFINQSEFAHSYQWYFGTGAVSAEEAPSYTFYDPGTYQVKLVATGDGGSAEAFQTITVYESPLASFRLADPLLEVNQPLVLINQSQGADHYSWDFGDGNHSFDFEPGHAYQQQGTYTITLVASTATSPQCHDTLSLVNGIRVQEPCVIYFPNAFRPDPSGPSGGYYTPGDPANTVFYPVYSGIRDYTLEIFNRWGELIFRSEDPLIGWDGYVNGRLSKMDVYVWRFSGRCQNGKTISKTGDVTLYR